MAEEASDMRLARSREGTAGMQPQCSRTLSLPFYHRTRRLRAQAESEAVFSAMYFGLANFGYS